MSSVSFGKLLDIEPRDAWPNEARDFTPWLAANIAHLAEATGIPLELTGTEVSVERFSADILARNPMDDTLVLIENQLEATDHTHLGQIMTYLAGLNAHTVVWIAPAFREPHLSAIRVHSPALARIGPHSRARYQACHVALGCLDYQVILGVSS